MNLQVALNSVAILTILILSIHGHSIYFHLLMLSFFYYYKQPYAPQNGQPKINEQIPKNIQSSKMEPEGGRK